jgi:hypothetical protein
LDFLIGILAFGFVSNFDIRIWNFYFPWVLTDFVSALEIMAKLKTGDLFPAATLQDVHGAMVAFPTILKQAPATVVFFYRGRW